MAEHTPTYEDLTRRVGVLERVIFEELNPGDCADELNKMIVEYIFERREREARHAGDVGTPAP